MKRRCYSVKSRGYKYYGGRGITVCDEWRYSFKAFIEHIGERPSPLHQIGRIDSNANYQPGNVRWETPIENNNNRRNKVRIVVNGQQITIAEWAKLLGINCGCAWQKYYRSIGRPNNKPTKKGIT